MSSKELKYTDEEKRFTWFHPKDSNKFAKIKKLDTWKIIEEFIKTRTKKFPGDEKEFDIFLRSLVRSLDSEKGILKDDGLKCLNVGKPGCYNYADHFGITKQSCPLCVTKIFGKEKRDLILDVHPGSITHDWEWIFRCSSNSSG